MKVHQRVLVDSFQLSGMVSAMSLQPAGVTQRMLLSWLPNRLHVVDKIATLIAV